MDNENTALLKLTEAIVECMEAGINITVEGLRPDGVQVKIDSVMLYQLPFVDMSKYKSLNGIFILHSKQLRFLKDIIRSEP